MRTIAPAAIIGLVATLAALGSMALGGPSLTALEWGVYDRWLRERAPISVSPALLVVARDAASETRFGAGSWDRALLARLIGNLTRAGATAVGVDVPLGQPSPPGRGGASSDAMLSQATAQAGAVVYPVALGLASAGAPEAWDGGVPEHRSWLSLREDPPALLRARPLSGPLPGLAQHASGVGHTLAPADGDGVVRKVPLFVQLGDRAVPAFGLALAAAAMKPQQASLDPGKARVGLVSIPVDERARVLINYAAADPQRGIRVVPFLAVWKVVEEGDHEGLRGLVDGKLVLVLAEPARQENRTPVGRAMSDMMIQAHLLNTVLTGNWPREAPATWTVLGTLLLSGFAAWLLLALSWWKGLAAVALLALGYAAGVVLALPVAGFVLPVWLPLAAVVLASAGGLSWIQFASAYRIRHLEGEVERVQKEVATVREALVREESTVEALEEDLEAARAAAARSAGTEQQLVRAADALRAQLVDARAQEGQTRGRLDQLERELRGLRAVDSRQGQLPDAEQERLRRECEQMGIVTRDPAVLALFRDLEKAARSSLPILLLGEPGTGKELFARAAHRLSPRANQAFIAVNMAAISPELFETELFGHLKGGFTGAVGDRKGYFELADRGTIFLDEIGDLRLEHQSKLLRVLQEKSFYRVGASRPTAVDVRVVAASNRDLERGVAEGWFREDLYFRLKGVVLRLSPLRERPEDLPLLGTRFVREAGSELGRDGVMLSEEALFALRGHDWSGNVRELQHCLRQAVALAEGPVITREDLRLPSSERAVASGPIDAEAESGSDTAVLACLRRHQFDMQATARALAWDRSTVTQRLKGMGFRALVEAGGDRAKAAVVLAGDPSLTRTVELKLLEYHEHLLRAVQAFDSPEAALRACRRRFKNLPERHFRSLELLVRQHLERRRATGKL